MNARFGKQLNMITFLMLVAMGTCLTPMVKADDTTSVEQLRKQVDALAQEVRVLRSSQNENWLNEKRADEVKSLVKAVLNDADTRASLLENSLTAGYNNGFFLASEDGNFKLRMMGMIEFRYAAQLRKHSSGDDGIQGFEIPAVRFGFKGHIIDPSWQFFIWNGQGYSKDINALNAMITKVINSNWSVTVGTTKVPLLREYLVSETQISFHDRTPLANVFSEGYTEGIWINYKKDWLKTVLCISDGGSMYVSSTSDGDAEGVALTLRGEALITGNWKQAGDIEAWLGEDPFLLVGGAVHYEKGEYGTTTDEASQLSWTIDANLKYKGFSLMGAFMGKHIDETTTNYDKFGALIQGGLFLTKDLELIARYAWGDSDVDNEDDLSIVSVGLSKFFKGHALRMTGELGYALNPISDSWDYAGWQLDAAGEKGQIMARAELHLLF